MKFILLFLVVAGVIAFVGTHTGGNGKYGSHACAQAQSALSSYEFNYGQGVNDNYYQDRVNQAC